MWRLYIIYHRDISPEYHQIDPFFDKEHIYLMQTSGYTSQKGYPKDYSSLGYKTHKELDFPFYNPELQKKKYFAPSVLYHMYKNPNLLKGLKYIGFLEYDFKFQISEKDSVKLGFDYSPGLSPTKVIQNTLQPNRIIALSVRWRLRELNKQNDIRVGKMHWLDYFVQEYNRRFSNEICKENLLEENPIIPTQQSFICDIPTFRKVMKFIVYLIDHSLLEDSKPAPATLLERYIGLCIHLCGCEISYLPLQHRAHHGYTL